MTCARSKTVATCRVQMLSAFQGGNPGHVRLFRASQCLDMLRPPASDKISQKGRGWGGCQFASVSKALSAEGRPKSQRNILGQIAQIRDKEQKPSG